MMEEEGWRKKKDDGGGGKDKGEGGCVSLCVWGAWLLARFGVWEGTGLTIPPQLGGSLQPGWRGMGSSVAHSPGALGQSLPGLSFPYMKRVWKTGSRAGQSGAGLFRGLSSTTAPPEWGQRPPGSVWGLEHL